MSANNWKQEPLSNFCRPKQWPTIPMSSFQNEGYPVFGANGKIGCYSEYNHEHPTVLITCRGATCGTINITEPFSYVTGNAMALDNLDEGRVDLQFLVHALERDGLQRAITGSAQPQITRTSLSGITIPLPPLPEQKRIAAILDKADAIRRKRRQALALADQFLRAVFLDSAITQGAYFDSENKALPADLAAKEHLEVCQGDVLLNRKNTYALVGSCVYVHETRPKLMMSDLIFRLTPKAGSKLSKIYLWACLSHPGMRGKIQELASGAAGSMPNVSKARLMTLKIPKPDQITQDRFSEIFNRTMHLGKTNDTLGLESADLFGSLTQLAFRGEL